MFSQFINTVLKKYAQFSGRVGRKEFWMFILCTFIINFVLGWIPFVGIIVSLAVVIPTLAIAARRLHDTGRSGWWLLLLIPSQILSVIGFVMFIFALSTVNGSAEFATLIFSGTVLFIVLALLTVVPLIYFLTRSSEPKDNKYGQLLANLDAVPVPVPPPPAV